MKRIAFFAHYDRHDIVDPYVERLLAGLSKHTDHIIVISHSHLDKTNQATLLQYANHVYLHENKGFDFGAWRYGLEQYGFENLNAFDEVLLVNDSCYGPITDFDDLFRTMKKKQADFWGMTDNGRAGGAGVDQYHLQSYFIGARRPVILSEKFKEFWNGAGEEITLKQAILRNEITFTTMLQSAGFTALPYFQRPTFVANTLNVSVFSPLLLIHNSVPLIKRKLFCYGSRKTAKKVLDFIKLNNQSLATEIEGHLSRTAAAKKTSVILHRGLRAMQCFFSNLARHAYKLKAS